MSREELCIEQLGDGGGAWWPVGFVLRMGWGVVLRAGVLGGSRGRSWFLTPPLFLQRQNR